MHSVPLFIKLHSVGTEGMINVRNINCITPYTEMTTYVYVNNRERPFCVDEPYEEIKKKLEEHVWIV